MSKKYNFSEKEVLVCNFATDERTIELSNYCFEVMGFENIITLKSNTGFVDKFVEFANLALKSEYKIFVRSDADRLVFSGIKDLIDKFVNDDIDCAEGYGHECFMNKFRGATPHVFSRNILSLLASDPGLMPRVQKPENYFINSMVKKGFAKEKTYNIFTNLHEYEQFPSKVCNSFLNRASRGHLGYYDYNFLRTMSKYVPAINHALSFPDKGKKSMDHLDFRFLDTQFSSIQGDELHLTYEKNLDIFNSLLRVNK